MRDCIFRSEYPGSDRADSAGSLTGSDDQRYLCDAAVTCMRRDSYEGWMGLKMREERVPGHCLVEYGTLCHHSCRAQMQAKYDLVIPSGDQLGGLCFQKAPHGAESRTSGWLPRLLTECQCLFPRHPGAGGGVATHSAESAARREASAFSA